MTRRIDYAGSVHDEREIEAVVAVLRGGPQALRIGKNVRAFEQGVAELFGKRRGVMCNSGSSALYLAVELLDLPPGDEIITSAVTFSTDIAPIVRAGLVPVFVDVEPDTYNVDVDAIEAMIGPRTRAILVPNLIGNVPDWDRDPRDRRRARAAGDRGLLRRARLDAARHADRHALRHPRHSFALSHIITAAGTGGMVCLDDDELVDRCLLLRRWGRRSEAQLFGSRQGRRPALLLDRSTATSSTTTCSSSTRSAGTSSRRSSPPRSDCVQLDKLPDNLARAQAQLRTPAPSTFAQRPDVFVLPRTTPRGRHRAGTCSRC